MCPRENLALEYIAAISAPVWTKYFAESLHWEIRSPPSWCIPECNTLA